MPMLIAMLLMLFLSENFTVIKQVTKPTRNEPLQPISSERNHQVALAISLLEVKLYYLLYLYGIEHSFGISLTKTHIHFHTFCFGQFQKGRFSREICPPGGPNSKGTTSAITNYKTNVIQAPCKFVIS